MKTLKDLEQLGVRELSVSNGQAVAVNPYKWTYYFNVGRHLNTKEVGENSKHQDFEDLNLPPLPCAESVKEGTYPIGRFSEQWQWLNVVQTNEWENITSSDMDAIIAHNLIDGSKEFRQALVLSEPAESEKLCPDCTNGLLNYGSNDIRDCPTCKGGGMIKAEPVSEQPAANPKLKIMEKLTITRTIELDSENLFGNIDDVIKYLSVLKKDHPDKTLELVEKWSGYEDNYFVLEYDTEETDEEYNSRIEAEQEEANRLRENEDIKRHNKEVRNKISDLKNQLK